MDSPTRPSRDGARAAALPAPHGGTLLEGTAGASAGSREAGPAAVEAARASAWALSLSPGVYTSTILGRYPGWADESSSCDWVLDLLVVPVDGSSGWP